ncbi:putative serine protease, subtilase family [Mariniradius saccharolyticus AK6]|uniref:Serine protease, subtilase family n=1 Tax=Mariniradius saccharolyticus AK6 TaxID=1239962 RepID=M7XH92_9BACT|nr:S8 family serine peptidase [Mariniradius saccharolyticus]EMS33888.1 putative serine protease, subtilase family [Mariniradius saccharolyticus AK6]
MVNFKRLLVLVLALQAGLATAQNRYAVYFKFKPQQTFSLNRPTEFLTAESIERRTRQSIALDSLDLPVSEKYIAGIAPLVDNVLYSSNWLNASVVVAKPGNIAGLAELPFVEKVVLVAPGLNDSRLEFGNRASVGQGYPVDLLSKTATAYDFQNELLGIPQMHEENLKGKGIRIAVFDAGFPGVNTIPAFAHLFTNGQIKGTRDFVHLNNSNVYSYHQHGTNVLSLIAANRPEQLVAGAPEADYILCITEDVPTEYWIEEYNWVRAAEYADSLGVDIINSSLGYWDFDDPSMNYTVADLDGETAAVTKGATIAANKGILIVNSVGNYGTRGQSSLTVPADARGILSVGSVGSNLTRSSFSSQGATADGRFKPEVAAFGASVQLIRSNGTLGPANGTSFAAPQIAALAAGLWQGRREWTKDELIEFILKSSTQYENPDNLLGYGIPDFFNAFHGEILAISLPGKESDWKIYPNPIEGTDLFVQFGNHLKGEFSLIDLKGNTIQKIEVSRNSVREPFNVFLETIPRGMYLVQMQSGREINRSKLLKR